MPVGVIELHLREVAQLFDSLDPCPFYERDLDTDAEEYIVASLQELGDHPAKEIVIYVDQPIGRPDEPQTVGQAIHRHFARRAQLTSRELRKLIRRGWISLVIGLSFLATLLAAGEVALRTMEPGTLANLLRESLLIGGWVAMWRPLEIILYDWWPIVGQRKTFTVLGRLPVRLVNAPT